MVTITQVVIPKGVTSEESITLLIAVASVAYASEPAKPAAQPELRPARKAMQARTGWMKAMNENLAAKKFV